LSVNPQDKYTLLVAGIEEGLPVPKESINALKGVVKGKMLARMKKEAVDCPVKGVRVSFVECFACTNFNRRVSGKVGCAGRTLDSR